MTEPEGSGVASSESHRGNPGGVLRLVAPLLLAGFLLVAHLEVMARGPTYTGPLLLVDHLFDLAVAVLALALFGAAGRWVLRLVDLEPSDPLEALLFATAVGPGAWALLLLVLGFAGLLEPMVLGAVVLLSMLLLRRDLAELGWEAGRLGRHGISRVFAVGGMSVLAVFAASVAGLVAGFLLLHGSAPPGDWDSLMYHLEIPLQWLEAGRIHVPDGNLHVAFTGLLQILYVPLLAVGSQAAPALLNGLFALLLGLATAWIGLRLFGTETGLLASVALWSSTGLLLVAVTARVDTTVAYFLLMGQSALALAVVEPDGTRDHLLRAGLVLGLAVGIKYHALAFGAALAPVGVWAVASSAEARKGGARLAFVALGVGLVAAAPWLIKNVALVGAPLYPFFSDRVLPPWLAELYGTREVLAAVGTEAAGILGEARDPFDLVALFLAPERLTVEQEAVHFHTSFLLLLLPLWVLHGKNRAVAALAVPALLYGAGLAVGRGDINLRYLFPVLAPLTVVTSFFLVDLVRRLPGAASRGRGLVLSAVGVLLLLPTAGSAVQWTRQFPVVSHATGSLSRQAYLEEGYSFYAGLAGTLNASVPENGRVLLLWEARGFYLAPEVLPDNVLNNWLLLSPHVERTGSCLEETDITHVLASTGAASYYQGRGVASDRLGVGDFARFADRCLVPIRVGAGFGLYRVPGRGPDQASR